MLKEEHSILDCVLASHTHKPKVLH